MKRNRCERGQDVRCSEQQKQNGETYETNLAIQAPEPSKADCIL